MLRVGLFGFGRIGRVHAANVVAHRQATLASVYETDPAGRDRAVDLYGVRACESVDELLGDDSIDAVIIASPTPTHVELLTASVRAGKATLCEKPIDLDISKVDACRAAIAEYEVPVMIGFHRRFDPSLAAIDRAVRAGEIGDVECLRITARDPAPAPVEYIAVSGGQVRDMTIHDFDLVRWLVDSEPSELIAMGANLFEQGYAELGDTDTVHLLIRTEAGAIATIENSRRGTYGYDQRLEIFGSEGALLMDNQYEVSLERHGAAGTKRRGTVLPGFIERYSDAYVQEIDHFVTSIVDGRTPKVSFEDGRKALLMADAALESMERNAIVAVPG